MRIPAKKPQDVKFPDNNSRGRMTGKSEKGALGERRLISADLEGLRKDDQLGFWSLGCGPPKNPGKEGVETLMGKSSP